MITWTAAQSPINQAGQIFFTYDGLSRLIARQHEGIDGDNEPFIVEYTGYLYDAWNHILTVRLNLDHTVRGRVASYVWGPDIGSRWLGQSSWQQAGGVGGLLMVIDGVATSPHSGTTWDPIDDDYVDSLAPHARLALRAAVGSLPRLPPVALVPLMDRMGNVTGYKKAHTSVPAAQLDAIYDYDAFGKEIRSTGPAADIVPYHFSTKRVDSTTGLVYYGYRWYDPAKGRWLSRDPIGEDGGMNLFGMVGNDIVNERDVLGLKIKINITKHPTYAQQDYEEMGEFHDYLEKLLKEIAGCCKTHHDKIGELGICKALESGEQYDLNIKPKNRQGIPFESIIGGPPSKGSPAHGAVTYPIPPNGNGSSYDYPIEGGGTFPQNPIGDIGHEFEHAATEVGRDSTPSSDNRFPNKAEEAAIKAENALKEHCCKNPPPRRTRWAKE